MRVISFYTLVLVLIFSSCGYPKLKKEAPAVNEIGSNSKFTIVLPEDHSTGYTWQLTQNYDATVVNQINEVWHGNAKGIYFNLESLAAGQTTLTFISRKYKDTADIKHFIVKIGAN